jgi:hypothetical protein
MPVCQRTDVVSGDATCAEHGKWEHNIELSCADESAAPQVHFGPGSPEITLPAKASASARCYAPPPAPLPLGPRRTALHDHSLIQPPTQLRAAPTVLEHLRLRDLSRLSAHGLSRPPAPIQSSLCHIRSRADSFQSPRCTRQLRGLAVASLAGIRTLIRFSSPHGWTGRVLVCDWWDITWS